MRIDFGKEVCHVEMFMENGEVFHSSAYYESDEIVLKNIIEAGTQYSATGKPPVEVFCHHYDDIESYRVCCGEVEAFIAYTDHMIIW